MAAGLEAAGARGQVQRLELEVERLCATNDVLAMQVVGGGYLPCWQCMWLFVVGRGCHVGHA